jgi:HlyD family secretion protein
MKTAILAFPLLLLAGGCAQPEAVEPDVVVQVKTEAARSEDIQVTISAPASVFPRSEAKVTSPLTAPIERLETKKGDSVRKGQPLAQLVRSDLEAQRAETIAQVADAEANLEKVTSGTLPGDIERAQGQVEVAAAALAEAQQVYESRQALFKEGAIPERELLVSKTQFEQARTTHRVAEKSLELLQKRSSEQDRLIAQSRLHQAQARLSYIETQLDYAEVRSPFDGVITEQFLYPGDMAKPDSPIFTVMDLSVAVGRGQFPESQAGTLRKGQVCSFEGLDTPGQRFTGKTTVINKAIDPVRRTVEVWCEIPNRMNSLKAGAFGQLGVVTETRHNATTVPLAAVQFEEGTKDGVVWEIGSDDLAHERKVTTGTVSGEHVEVASGLNAGANVVIEGGYGLAEGIKVRTAAPGAQESSR